MASRDLGSIQILRPDIRKDFPEWLQEWYEASQRARTSPEIQRAAQLLRTNWRMLSRSN
jgi:hypothetical protein